MDIESFLTRKITKVVKTWAPVLLLMGLLIAVDSLDSVHGKSLLGKIKLSLGFETAKYHHQQVSANEYLSSNRETKDNNIKISEFWKARLLLQRSIPLAKNPTPEYRLEARFAAWSGDNWGPLFGFTYKIIELWYDYLQEIIEEAWYDFLQDSVL